MSRARILGARLVVTCGSSSACSGTGGAIVGAFVGVISMGLPALLEAVAEIDGESVHHEHEDEENDDRSARLLDERAVDLVGPQEDLDRQNRRRIGNSRR